MLLSLLPVLLLFSCGGSNANKDNQIPVRQLATTVQCGGVQTQARVIALQTKQQMNEFINTPADVDFARERVLMIAMGQQRTGGYGLRLASTEARINQGVMDIAVDWRQPSPGSMLIQVITSPCILISLPQAKINAIRIIDQHKMQKLELKLQ